MPETPLVSIVTPSLDCARFLERTIESVFSQNYPHIEYLVMDGGSTDGTLEILRRYEGRLTYDSQPDRGAPDAINRGFNRARGSILAWLSADDTYLPGAVSAAVRHLAADREAAVIYGEAYWIDAQGQSLGRYPTVAPWNPALLERECTICQPAAFMRREAVESVGGLDASARHSFDYDLWMRLAKRFRFKAIPEYLATSRMHTGTLSLARRQLVFEEVIRLLNRHYGYVPPRWIYGYLRYREDRRDQFFEPLRHSPATYLKSLPAGLRRNRKHPLRYVAEWLGLRGG